MKKILNEWTMFEKILLFGSVILVSLVGLIFKSDLLTTICFIVGIITALLLAKGKKFRTNIWFVDCCTIYNSII